MLLLYMFLLFLLLGITASLKTQRFIIMKKDVNYFDSKKIYTPKTENQKIYTNYLESQHNYILSAIGPAGTGKTLLACNEAIYQLKRKTIEKIIITRPVVTVEEDIGFLPGNLEKKMDPWVRPIFDILQESYTKSDIKNMMANDIIEISPLGFMRGRTFKNSFIIADEMQNSTPNQMLMLLTRIGINSKMVITGDLAQSDRIENNGLKDFVNKLKNNKIPEYFYLVEMDEKDVQRCQLVNDVLQLYNPKKIETIENVKSLEPIKNNTVNTGIVKHFDSFEKTIDATKNGNRDAALIPLKDIKKIHYSNWKENI